MRSRCWIRHRDGMSPALREQLRTLMTPAYISYHRKYDVAKSSSSQRSPLPCTFSLSPCRLGFSCPPNDPLQPCSGIDPPLRPPSTQKNNLAGPSTPNECPNVQSPAPLQGFLQLCSSQLRLRASRLLLLTRPIAALRCQEKKTGDRHTSKVRNSRKSTDTNTKHLVYLTAES